MNKNQFDGWLKTKEYNTSNDWNYQEIDGHHFYFIMHNSMDRYALIKELPATPHNMEGIGHEYEVLIENWTDYNGWNEI